MLVVEFYSLIVRGCWSNISVLNVLAPARDKSEDIKKAFMRNYTVYLITSQNTVFYFIRKF
jgi:hypothetical protein